MNGLRQATGWLKGDMVLTISWVLAILSCFLVPPDGAYLAYIDWHTLALLFALMAVMKGYSRAGVFETMGAGLLRLTHASKGVLAVLVFLPFFTSMVITNDVALITFVPFGLAVLRMAGRTDLAVRLVVLQTLAANLGSMLTPMGNPQNLYLYQQSGMGFVEFCGVTLPYVLVSGICLGVGILWGKGQKVELLEWEAKPIHKQDVLVSSVGFALSLAAIGKLISPLLAAGVVLVFLLVKERKLLLQLDYGLLATFVGFFIFIGNLGRVDVFRSLLEQWLSHGVELVAVIASQCISNVPAALLLTGFTQQWNGLIVGCNLGGLGTLIASMASLISYKILVAQFPQEKRRYLLVFSGMNLVLLVILLGLWYAL